MTEATAETTTPPAASDSQPTDDVARLNAALTKERELRKEAERKAKDGLTAKQRLDEIEAASASDLEKAVKAARAEGYAEAQKSAHALLLRSEARALAAEIGFADPTDAIALVDLAGVRVEENGDVDSEAVKKELAGLAERKQYLLKSTEPPVPTPGQAGIGVSGGTVARDPRSADLAQIEADLSAAQRR